jgi:hypothetical protein
VPPFKKPGVSAVFYIRAMGRVSVQGVKSLYEVKKNFFYYFSKRKWKYFYTFYHFYSEKSSKRAK